MWSLFFVSTILVGIENISETYLKAQSLWTSTQNLKSEVEDYIRICYKNISSSFVVHVFCNVYMHSAQYLSTNCLGIWTSVLYEFYVQNFANLAP